MPTPRTPGPMRFLFFTNECVGLGHLRRCLTLATAVCAAEPGASALIVTGSQYVPHGIPPGVDIVKLPAFGRDEAGGYFARTLGLQTAHLSRLRAGVASAIARDFAPDVAVVDKLPLGLDQELAPALWELHTRGVRIVLGLRDIEDSPEVVRRRWDEGHHARVLETLYDQVLVYGPESSLDMLDCVDWDRQAPPVEHVGFVGAAPETNRPDDMPAEYLLVTFGGGVDGHPLAAAYLDGLRMRPLGVPTVLVTGPLMPADDVEDLRRRAHGLDVLVQNSRSDLAAVAAHARAAVSMAGYNTVSELLRAGTPALLVPRTRPSREQQIRAERLAGAGLVEVILPEGLDPSSLREAVDRVLARPRTTPGLVHADGAARAAQVLLSHARIARCA
ncbi:MAG TPA: glycosyltransferase [Dermatophilaceae bacterium]|nr:glycosyltransferase [Dermatophilaceae bacterium]